MGRISIALSAVLRGKVLHFQKTTGTFAVLTVMLTGVAAHADESRQSDVIIATQKNIDFLQSDIAALKAINNWQQQIIEVARTDPEEALRTRLPMSVCLATSIGPACHKFTGTFVPDK